MAQGLAQTGQETQHWAQDLGRAGHGEKGSRDSRSRWLRPQAYEEASCRPWALPWVRLSELWRQLGPRWCQGDARSLRLQRECRQPQGPRLQCEPGALEAGPGVNGITGPSSLVHAQG